MIAEAIEARPATPTERMVAAMLLENTGAAMMDSGMYGRAWQTTRAEYGLDGGLPNSTFHGGPGHATAEPQDDEIERVALAMREQPPGRIDDFGTVMVDTFHWLVDRLDYDPDLDAKYQLFERVHNLGKDAYDADWGMTIGDRFMELLVKRGLASGGIYPGEGSIDNAWINTYNGENALDRTLQFALFHIVDKRSGYWNENDEWIDPREPFLPEGSYVLLQIHGGADVRGGYTDPRLFRIDGEQADLFDNDRMEVWCAGATINPDDQAPGQLRVDGSPPPEPYETFHRWDNSYGDSRLRLTYADGQWFDSYPQEFEQILALPYHDEEAGELHEKGIQTEYGYTTPEGKVIRTDKYAVANVARRDDDGWHCPFDDSPLRASGAVVG